MDATPTEGPFLTVMELAELLRVSRRTAYILVSSGQVPSVRVGGSIRIPRAALGLINSPPHSGKLPDARMRAVLRSMALGARGVRAAVAG